MKKVNKNKGITLISLVITIIVMLILVGVSITLAVKGGLFGYAGKAVSDTNSEKNKEGELGTGSVIEQYVYGISEEVSRLPVYSKELLDEETKVLTTNTKYISGNYVAVIPKGFKISEVDGEKEIDTGLVIQDKKGNEFVWIPVTYTKKGTLDEEGYDIEFKKTFYRSEWISNAATGGERGAECTDEGNYREPLTSGGYEDEKADYDDMLKSVYKNGGFYIGRYEAGIKTTEEPRSTSTLTTTENWVVQRNCYPYNYVGWGPSTTEYEGDVRDSGSGAFKLCKDFYTESDKVGVISTLCYGIQWDAMLDFIKDSDHDVAEIATWGNYSHVYGDAWKVTSEDAKWSTSGGESWTSVKYKEIKKADKVVSTILLTTGASDKFSSKNIYDVGGNVAEWTNEGFPNYYRTVRGGNYSYYGSAVSVGGRDLGSPSLREAYIGFRPALYITN